MKSILQFTAICATLLATSAIAQERALEEVVVTAQKREQAITDVSLSIRAFTGRPCARERRFASAGYRVPHTQCRHQGQCPE